MAQLIASYFSEWFEAEGYRLPKSRVVREFNSVADKLLDTKKSKRKYKTA